MLKFLEKIISGEFLKSTRIIKLSYLVIFVVLYSSIAYGYDYLTPDQIRSKISTIDNQIERISNTKKTLVSNAEIEKDSARDKIRILNDELVELNEEKIDLSKKQDEIYKITNKLRDNKSLLELNRENQVLLELKKDADNDELIKKFKIEIKSNIELIEKNKSKNTYWQHHEKMYRSITKAGGVRGGAAKDDLSRAKISDALGYVFKYVANEPKTAKDLIKVIFNGKLNSGHLRTTDGVIFKGIVLSFQLALLPLVVLAELTTEDDPNDWRVKLDLWKTNCRIAIVRFAYDRYDKRDVREFRKACMVDIKSPATYENKLALRWDTIDYLKYELIPKAVAKKSIYSKKLIHLQHINRNLNQKYKEREKEIELSVRSKFDSLYPDPEFKKKQDSLKKDLDLNSLTSIKKNEEMQTIINHENKNNNDINDLNKKIDEIQSLLEEKLWQLNIESNNLMKDQGDWNKKLKAAIIIHNNNRGNTDIIPPALPPSDLIE